MMESSKEATCNGKGEEFTCKHENDRRRRDTEISGGVEERSV